MLTVDCVSKVFHGKNSAVEVLRCVTFGAEAGEVVVLLGPNGCGKTTLLNLAAGIDTPTSGLIGIRPPTARYGYVFQNYTGSLLPWLTLEENILLPLKFEGLTSEQRRRRLAAFAETYSLGGVPLSRYPSQASGGQKQRACIARAVLTASPLLLLDEPFSALDHEGRETTFALIEESRSRDNRLSVVVLHDLDDAIRIADRILVLDGKPASIAHEFSVDLPRPRSGDDRVTTEFTSLRHALMRVVPC